MARKIPIFIAILLIGYVAFAITLLSGKGSNRTCSGIEIIISDSLKQHFISKKEVLRYLNSHQISPIDKPMAAINTEEIEKTLMGNELIANVEVFKTPSGIIKFVIEQKIPILRIISNNGNYYIDNSGRYMPYTPNYAVDVPLATGSIEKEFAMTNLYDFTLFLRNNKFWDNQIEQIYVHPNGDVELIPRVGNHRIILGALDDYEEKLKNLMLFYEQVIPKTGWEKYKIINLKYKNQLVCIKNNS